MTTALTKVVKPGTFSQTGVTATSAAADVAGNTIQHGGGLLMITAYNSGSTSRTVTLTSYAEANTGRTGDAVATITAGQECVFLVAPNGWTSNGVCTVTASHAEVKLWAMDL